MWLPSNPADPAIRVLADRHYSRQTPGSVRFVQAGRTAVFKVPGGRKEWAVTVRKGEVVEAQQIEAAAAGWVTHWPIAEYVRHDWSGSFCEACAKSKKGESPHVPKHETPGTWVNQFFHNESQYLASDLIREAVKATLAVWEPPALGMITMIDPGQVRRTRKPGYTYLKAGFELVGQTKTKPRKLVFQLTPERM